MEFLQTIWTSLTTHNEVLIKLIGIPITFIDIYICMLFFTTILNINVSKNQKILYTIVFGVLSNISAFLISPTYKIFITMILWPVMVFTILKANLLKSILSEIVILVLTSILEFIFANFLYNVFHINSNQIITIPIYKLLVSFTIYLIIFLLTILIRYFKINIQVFDNMHKKTKILLITNSLLLILVVAMQFYLLTFYSNTMPLFITLISIIGLIAYFAISIYNVVSSSKLETTERDLEGANLTIHSLRVLHDTVRTFKHDFDNIINGIGGYIANNDMDGLKEYYNQLLQDCHKTNNLYSLSPDVINQPAIYNILATKYYIADELNIQIDLDIFLDLNEIEKHMKIYEFTRILGILLDNSIEASKDCEEKLIKVSFRKEDTKHRIIVAIENTYNNKDVNIDKIFDKGFSSKDGNTGLGLWKVRQILKRNNNLNLFTTKNKEFFKQQFEIYY